LRRPLLGKVISLYWRMFTTRGIAPFFFQAEDGIRDSP